jgi:hypothetical protein
LDREGLIESIGLIGAENFFYRSRVHLTQIGEATGNLRTFVSDSVLD